MLMVWLSFGKEKASKEFYERKVKSLTITLIKSNAFKYINTIDNELNVYQKASKKPTHISTYIDC